MRIVVFGDLPIATLVVKHVMNDDNVELVGVVIGNQNPTNNDPWKDVPILSEYAEQEGIRKFQLDELLHEFKPKELLIGFSCRFSKILKKEHIDLFRLGIVNFHGGLLPEFGGLYSSCHTILEGANEGGGTLHFIDEGIDTGDIIKRARFQVLNTDTTSTVFNKTQNSLFDSFIEVYEDLINGRINITNQSKLLLEGHKKRYYGKESLEGKKEFKLSDNHEEIDKKIRAFDFPDKEPAFFKIKDKKYFVRTKTI